MSLIKNSFWNISGYVIPFIISIPSLGYLARTLGIELFGLYTLCLAIVGYAGIFDAGISRAVVREIAIYRNNYEEKNRIISNSLFLLSLLSIIGAGALVFFSTSIVTILNVNGLYTSQVKSAIHLISIALPIFLLTQVMMAILEGQEKFKLFNFIRTISSSCISFFPAIFVYLSSSNSLIFAIIGLLIARIMALILSFYFCFHKEHVKFRLPCIKIIIRLIKFGGWITITNIISPIMTYFDRFILSHNMGAQNVAFYTAPSEGISRISIIPSALSRAIFPKLSNAKNKKERLEYEKTGLLLMFIISSPIFILGFLFSKDILEAWMGTEFSGTPSDVFKILLVGFLFNALAQIPYSSLQASGYSNITAYIHISELIPYLVTLFYLVSYFGVLGAATAWSIRMFIDMSILIIINIKIKRFDDNG
ncbi:oligosaccharide flippase family protein [Providencia rettgeri]|uniref:flippase n=1 Tax=Providencia sp. PROV200 TaxID=2936794 RepID=UPI001BD2EC8A|nr:flippase [Providencia rettgeri]